MRYSITCFFVIVCIQAYFNVYDETRPKRTAQGSGLIPILASPNKNNFLQSQNVIVVQA